MIEFYALGQKVITFFMVKIAARRYSSHTHTAFNLGELGVHLVEMLVYKHHQRLDGKREGEDRRSKGLNGGSTTADASSCTYDY